jgi:Protein of unknown function (DUF3800)
VRATTFIDDSGSGAKLFDLDGNPIPQSPSQPLILVLGLIVLNPALERFKKDWELLRKQIQQETKAAFLPTVHVRLMFGENDKISPNYGASPNPYLNVLREKRLEFIERALEIIHHYGKQNLLFTSHYAYIKQSYIEDVTPYYESELFKSEYAFLRSKSFKATKKLHTLICNPHIHCLSYLIINLERQARKHKIGSMDIIYDRNPLSKGFDVDYTLQLMRSRGRLARIGRVAESNEIDTPFLQAADVCCNIEYKRQVKERVTGVGSEIVDEWLARYPIPGLPISPVTSDIFTQIITVHYAVARHGVETSYPEFADAFLVSVEEFRRRSAAGRGLSVGTSILK